MPSFQVASRPIMTCHATVGHERQGLVARCAAQTPPVRPPLPLRPVLRRIISSFDVNRKSQTWPRPGALVVRAGPSSDGSQVAETTKSEEASAELPKEGGGVGVPAVWEDSDEEVSSLMEGVTFAQLCDDFECVSSPAVERTARLLARDIHDIRENRRTISCFAVDVKYRDPLRSFVGRERYRRPSWILNGLEYPQVTMVSMEMLSTSVLVIKWRLRGSFRMVPAADALGASLNLLVISTFSLNQISGQVTEHRDEWDLSRTPPSGIVTFYSSRLAWTAVQSGKDLSDVFKMVGSVVDRAKRTQDIYPDPSGDPRKFFVQDDPNRELYQYAFAVALLYLLVQFLRQVL